MLKIIFRTLPPTFRDRFREFVIRFAHLLLFRHRSAQTEFPARPIVVGLLQSPTGLGEGARRTFKALESLNYSPLALDLSCAKNCGSTNKRKSVLALEPFCEKQNCTVILQVNAGDTLPAILNLGWRLFRDSYRIAYWAWELPTVPRYWVRTAKLFDEIWVPSHYVRDALIRSGISTEVIVVPHPLIETDLECVGDLPLNLDPGFFHVLSVFDLRSSIDRKNPFAVIRAFNRSNPGKKNGLLWLKVSGANARPQDFEALQTHCQDNPRIKLVSETFTDNEMKCLVSSVDVYISLHRSEGFGLLLSDACALGTAVIATGWSGNMEFMDHPSACLTSFELTTVLDRTGNYSSRGNIWAEPSIESATALLNRLYEDSAFLQKTALDMKTHVTNFLSTKEFARQVSKHLGRPPEQKTFLRKPRFQSKHASRP